MKDGLKNVLLVCADVASAGDCTGIIKSFGGGELVICHGKTDGGNAQGTEFI